MSNTIEASTNDQGGPEFLPTADRAKEEFTKILSAVNRQKKAIAISVVVSVLLGIGFVVQAVPRYTSYATLLIDAKQVGLSAASAFEGSLAFESGAVDSQVLVLMSDRVAATVAEKLNLTKNPAFVDPPQSLFGTAFAALKGTVAKAMKAVGLTDKDTDFADLPPEVQRMLIVQQLQLNLKVTRNARTYVMTIEYTDPDPVLARTIAGTYASAYLEDQLEAKFDATRRASIWLDDRIREIKAKASTADQAAQAFRTKNNLISASGRLITEQALTDATAQLSVARNDLNSAQAKYDRLKQIVETKEFAGSSIEALTNPIISQLRTKYLQASKLNSDISARFGAQHQSAVNARKEMEQYSQLILDEISRLLQTYQSEVQIATDRVGSLERSIDEMRSGNQADAAALAKLKTLEQEASTYNNLYDAYLRKAQEMLQQQSFPVTDARIIAEAAIPLLPSSPKKLLVLLGSIIVGFVIGGAIAAFREFRERGFRTATQVREELGLDFVAYIPEMPKSVFDARSSSSEESRSSRSERVVRPTHGGMEIVLDEPLSRYAESMRAMKVSTDFRFGMRRPLVLGFVSMFPNEGKSTTAKNFASLVAAQGERVLLIDGDLRNPQLTRMLAPSAKIGLVDLLHSPDKTLAEALHIEERSKLVFLPGATHRRIPETGDVLGSQAMFDLIRSATARFDIVVVDLPPLGAVIDAVAACRFIDGYHLVVEWGNTPRSAVRDMLVSETAIVEKTIGVTLSKVEIGKLEMFDTHASYGYVGEYQSRYYGMPQS